MEAIELRLYHAVRLQGGNMSSSVLELQHDALQPDVRVIDLLRKSLVVAKKLGLGEFEEWVNAELNVS
jgi:hypothetical protein